MRAACVVSMERIACGRARGHLSATMATMDNLDAARDEAEAAVVSGEPRFMAGVGRWATRSAELAGPADATGELVRPQWKRARLRAD